MSFLFVLQLVKIPQTFRIFLLKHSLEVTSKENVDVEYNLFNIFMYKFIFIFVYLIRYPITTQEFFDRFTSSFDWGAR